MKTEWTQKSGSPCIWLLSSPKRTKRSLSNPGSVGGQPSSLSSHLPSFLGKENWSSVLCPSGRREAHKLYFFLFPIFVWGNPRNCYYCQIFEWLIYYLYVIFRCHNYHNTHHEICRIKLVISLRISILLILFEVQDSFIRNRAALSLIKAGFLEKKPFVVPLWFWCAPHAGSRTPLPVGSQFSFPHLLFMIYESDRRWCWLHLESGPAGLWGDTV